VGAVAGMAGPDPSDPIPIAGSRIVCVQLLSSFLSQGKLVQLAMLPITIEIELADQRDAFVGTTENLWEIARPRVVANVCDLDQALSNS
jgi:hypothetical protein